MNYPYLFQKGSIGNVEIKNRIVMAPLGIGGLMGYMGTFSDRSIDYYERRAIGETGLIITGLCLVNSKIEPWERDGVSLLLTFDSGWKVRSLLQLTERVHDYGTKIFAQLTAGFGRVYPARLADALRVEPIAPSPMPLFWRPKIMARELNTTEVDTLVEAFGNAAQIAQQGQFDGVELHGHEGYLMDQFTSALWNRRTDKYGGDLRGRMNFVLSIIKAIQEKAGSDFPIVYRYGPDHKIKNGRSLQEGIEMAKILEKAGVAALHVDAGCYDNWYWAHPPLYQPPGCMVDMAQAVKPHVKIPVITVGRLGYPELANQVIEEEKADFVALGRPLLADPDFAAKARRGKANEIRPCIGCHVCLDRIVTQRALSCAVNPQCGDEKRLEITPTSEPKKIMVVGGGPAGMEAARVCALRGHRVTLFEKSGRLGGLLHLASKADFKQDIRHFLDYQVSQFEKLGGLEVRMNIEVDESMIKAERPDVIFIATGSVPLRRAEIKGLDSLPFVTPAEVYEDKIPRGAKAFVIGGGSVGCETALYLAQKDWSVTVAEMFPEAASDLFEANQKMLLEMMRDQGVELLPGTKVVEVRPGTVYVVTEEGERAFDTDLLVLAVGHESVNNLVKGAEGLVEDVYVIGDCESPRKIKDAIWEAFKRARVV